MGLSHRLCIGGRKRGCWLKFIANKGDQNFGVSGTSDGNIHGEPARVFQNLLQDR